MSTSPTPSTRTMVPAYRILATGQVLCAACASESSDSTRSMDAQMVFTRRKAGFTCVGCEAARDMAPGAGDHSPAAIAAEHDAGWHVFPPVAPGHCPACDALYRPQAAVNDGETPGERAMIAQALAEPDLAGLPNLEDTAPTVEIIDVTTAYRVKITWLDGFESLIGDWPTRRIARAEAQRWIEREQANHSLPPARLIEEAPAFTCTGRSSVAQEACSFTTDNEIAAHDHFEIYEHVVVARDGTPFTACTCQVIPHR